MKQNMGNKMNNMDQYNQGANSNSDDKRRAEKNLQINYFQNQQQQQTYGNDQSYLNKDQKNKKRRSTMDELIQQRAKIVLHSDKLLYQMVDSTLKIYPVNN